MLLLTPTSSMPLVYLPVFDWDLALSLRIDTRHTKIVLGVYLFVSRVLIINSLLLDNVNIVREIILSLPNNKIMCGGALHGIIEYTTK